MTLMSIGSQFVPKPTVRGSTSGGSTTTDDADTLLGDRGVEPAERLPADERHDVRHLRGQVAEPGDVRPSSRRRRCARSG